MIVETRIDKLERPRGDGTYRTKLAADWDEIWAR